MDKVKKIIELAEAVKAEDIVVLDLRKICTFCDYFIICTGTSSTHIKAIADQINSTLRDYGFKAQSREGYQESRWIVLDYASVLVHIFDQDARDFYALENLWSKGKKVNLKQTAIEKPVIKKKEVKKREPKKK
ncbi:MAG: ribosome silencing factor [Candidatus Omnitrophica bacterium]|nr:ribosome silencing factor [Candidatus Omnitrophota bacterium]